MKPVIEAFCAIAHKRSFAPRHTIIHAGDPPQSLYLILEGSVSILLEDEDGREIVLAYLGAGDFFGEVCLFPDQNVRTAIVRTRTPTLVAEVGYQMFRDFAAQHPQIMFEIAGQLAARLRDTTRRLGDLAFLDVAGRMAHILLELVKKPDAQPHPRGTLIRTSRQELARLVGCSREMAGRVLKKLEEDGMVSSIGRSILVLGISKG
ncbi:CRP/FNR family transcriptional regulator, cyclic AMP receptor protein [Fontimonas thermophila]|uniref:CRP/FNR family transcriptional regulator, cyclic AMP receptor protein n=1 Tax=Fontimonas thermophila TaxID=1076937 RepID=A0A1I2J4E8_9GAMM|nr:cyclic nucleotide-binding domain-containing protein [Fontimonas thermophila]SFF48880.1 CRP/FNR family transcriptional regulator, cyclic AMP receptor protein [Fontimonas thermophila]